MLVFMVARGCQSVLVYYIYRLVRDEILIQFTELGEPIDESLPNTRYTKLWLITKGTSWKCNSSEVVTVVSSAL